MKTFNELQNNLNEQFENTEAGKLAKEIESEIKKVFPKSFVSVNFSASIHPSITGRFALGKDKSQWVNGIFPNDPANTTFFIEGFDKEGNLKDKFVFDPRYGFTLAVKPPEGSYLAYGRVKSGVRKKSGNLESVKKHVINSFKKFKDVIKANKSNLTDEHLKLIGKNI